MRRLMFCAVLCVFALCGVCTSAFAASFVLAGSDYLTTQPGTVFAGVPFNGVPVGPGNTDTIVQRLRDATFLNLGDSSTIPIEMLSLNLASAVPVDFGLGLGTYYITLQTARGGPASVGQMTITYSNLDDGVFTGSEGTFSSFFDVFFDVRFGSLNGPIAMSSDLVLSNSGTPWDANPDPTVLLVNGLVGNLTANWHTNKIDNVDIHDMDFFPVGVIQEIHPNGAQHNADTTHTPEPASAWLLGAGLLAIAGGLKKARL